MKTLKAAIFDIDNTLIAHKKQEMLQEVLTALLKLKENGIEVIVATGRGYYFIHEQIKNELRPSYTVTINGGVIVDENGKVFYHQPMDLEDVNIMTKESRRLDFALGFKAVDCVYVMTDFDYFHEKYLGGFKDDKILVDYSDVKEITEKDSAPVGAFLIAEPHIEKVKELIPLTKNSYYAVASRYAYDIYDINSGKDVALEVVLDHLGITWDEVIAFGDSDNDVEMIRKAGVGVAMGNGYDSVKEVADFVTKPLDELGVVHALKEYKLI